MNNGNCTSRWPGRWRLRPETKPHSGVAGSNCLAPDESSLVFNDKQDHEAPSTLMSKMAAPSRQPSTWWIGWNPGHGTKFYDVAYPTLCPFFYRNPNESAKGQLLGRYLTVNSSKSKDVVGYIVEREHSNAARSLAMHFGTSTQAGI